MKKDFLKKKREGLGITTYQAAKKIGISQPYYCQIECSKRVPSIRVAKLIAGFYGFSLDDFFKGGEFSLENELERNPGETRY